MKGILKGLRVRSLLDAGCGDSNWMKELSPDLDRCVGTDAVPELVESNRKKYANEAEGFISPDITPDQLPQVEAVLSPAADRWCEAPVP